MSTNYQILTAEASYQAVTDLPLVPGQVSNFLGRLSTLEQIPFQYLVSDEKMLPSESIRFFQLDEQWINALLDGAYSIARTNQAALTQDQALWTKIKESASEAARKLRTARLGHSSSNNNSGPLGTVSGFLLRSQVIVDFPKMEVMAYAKEGASQPLPILRMEHLSPSMLLALYEGDISQVVFRQPAEGIHFGLDIGDTGEVQYIKYLRYLDGKLANGESRAGTLIKNPAIKPQASDKANRQLTPAPAFRDVERRVLPITHLAQNLQANVKQHDTSYGGQFTSAEFALEMCLGVGRAIFQTPKHQ